MKQKDNQSRDDFAEIEKEAISQLNSGKSDIAKIINNSKFEFNRDKSTHLGYRSEEVLYQYTFDALDDPKTYLELSKIMSDKKIGKIVINGSVCSEEIIEIVKKANGRDIPFIITEDPQFQGDIALAFIEK